MSHHYGLLLVISEGQKLASNLGVLCPGIDWRLLPSKGNVHECFCSFRLGVREQAEDNDRDLSRIGPAEASQEYTSAQ